MAASQSPPFHRGLTTRKLKTGVFTLEMLNALGTTYFFYDIYYYTRDQFHFKEIQNLWLAAALGTIYVFAAFFGGRFAQRFGYLTAVQWGAGLMTAVFLLGSQIHGLFGTLAVIVAGDIGMCLTWPALEALMSEGEPPVRLQSLVGIYNFVWAGAGAFAYFVGGALLEKWGAQSIFYVPAIILFAELGLAVWLEREARREPLLEADPPLLRSPPEAVTSPVSPAVFLKMAWLANPLAYLAINTVISTLPSLAKHFRLSLMEAGFCCSIWLFARTAAFLFLRFWPKWHYRFRFLIGSYIAMIFSFGGILLGPNLWVFGVSQLIFGAAIGLIYYSSLFYSMDVGETKGEHGGIHEAAIGAGNASGPALAAVALTFFPAVAGSAAISVCGLLIAGMGVLAWMRFRENN